MKLTKACDYASKAIIFMSLDENRKSFMRSELSKECNIPSPFMGKILQKLVKGNILSSEKGKNGGFSLSVPPEKLTLLDIVEAVEGKIYIHKCLCTKILCNGVDNCVLHKAWEVLQNTIREKLHSITIKNIIEEQY